MRLRRTLFMGVTALGLASGVWAQYPQYPGPSPRPPQMGVPVYTQTPGFPQQQPMYAPPQGFQQPTFGPSQMQTAPQPYITNYQTPPNGMFRLTTTNPPALPTTRIPVSRPASATSPALPRQEKAEQVPTPPKQATPPADPPEEPPVYIVEETAVLFDAAEERGGLNRFYIQGGYVFLQPRWNGNPSFAFATTDPTGVFLTSTGQRDFAFDWSLAPRIELGGAFPGGFGVRSRWMYFDQTAQDTFARTAATQLVVGGVPLGLQDGPGVGETATATARLYFHTVDLEGIQEWRSGPLSVFAFGGLRYSYLQQNYDYLEANAGGGSDTLSFLNTFNGVGPTVGAQSRREFQESGLGVFALTRGSLLFGRYSQNASNIVPGFPTRTATKSEEDLLPMTELEVGIDWSRSLSSGARLFVSVSGFGQLWMATGNSSDSSPTFTQDPLGPAARLSAVDANSQSRQNLGLLGISMNVGLQF